MEDRVAFRLEIVLTNRPKSDLLWLLWVVRNFQIQTFLATAFSFPDANYVVIPKGTIHLKCHLHKYKFC